jgi:hypothetical protein
MTTDLDERLRRASTAVQEYVARGIAVEPQTLVETPIRRRQRGPVLLVALAATLVLVAVGLTVLVSGSRTTNPSPRTPSSPLLTLADLPHHAFVMATGTARDGCLPDLVPTAPNQRAVAFGLPGPNTAHVQGTQVVEIVRKLPSTVAWSEYHGLIATLDHCRNVPGHPTPSKQIISSSTATPLQVRTFGDESRAYLVKAEIHFIGPEYATYTSVVEMRVGNYLVDLRVSAGDAEPALLSSLAAEAVNHLHR